MSDPQNLEDIYIEELSDLWSANDQMQKVVGDMAEACGSGKLSDMLTSSAQGIEDHTKLLKQLLQDVSDEAEPEHCKGMEGLVKEARKHALEADVSDDVRDVAIIAQYQRMCHYGIAGFGTAKAFAEALEKTDAAEQLDEALVDIYEADEYMSELAERSKNLEARA